MPHLNIERNHVRKSSIPPSTVTGCSTWSADFQRQSERLRGPKHRSVDNRGPGADRV